MIRVSFITNFPSLSLPPAPAPFLYSEGSGNKHGKGQHLKPPPPRFCSLPSARGAGAVCGAGGRRVRGRCARAGPGRCRGLGAGGSPGREPGARLEWGLCGPGAAAQAASGRRDNTDPPSEVLGVNSTSSHITRQRERKKKKNQPQASTPSMSGTER